MTDLTTEARPQAHRRPANQRIKFIVGGGVIALAIIYLIFTATQSTAAYFLTIGEVYDKGPAIYGRNVRVTGNVITDTIDYNSRDLVLRFKIVDDKGDTLPVLFNGPKPDELRPDAEAIVEGKFDGQQFTAQTLLLKCPSRYEEKGFTEQKVEAVR